MNYEQKYNEALERAKGQLEGAKVFDYNNLQIAHDIRSTVYNIFPQLKETKDERIKKAILIYLDWLDGRKDYAPKSEYSIRDMIAWLEKQGNNADKVKQQQAIEIPFGAKDSELQEATYHIPDGYHVEINGNAVVIKKGELINDTPSQDHWQELRERAAIAALPQCVKAVQDALMLGATIEEGVIEQATASAIDIADALVKKLKGE